MGDCESDGNFHVAVIYDNVSDHVEIDNADSYFRIQDLSEALDYLFSIKHRLDRAPRIILYLSRDPVGIYTLFREKKPGLPAKTHKHGLGKWLNVV